MGLIYIFPVSDDGSDGDRVQIKETALQKQLLIKTYGLPLIFWGYLLAALITIAFMWVASHDALVKLQNYDDPWLVFIAILTQCSLALAPLVLLGFFFYEKNLIKQDKTLLVSHKLFFLPLWQKKMVLQTHDAFKVDHFLDSPNMAKIKNQHQKNKEAMRQFENRGYFELIAETAQGRKTIDRHSRKADLLKLQELLSRY